MPKNPPFAEQFDISSLDTIYSVPKDFPPFVNKRVFEFYNPPPEDKSNLQEIQQTKEIYIEGYMSVIPLHTSLFSHESYKFKIQNLINEYKNIDTNAFLRFE